MSRDTVTLRDNRTGLEYELPINHGSINAGDLRAVKSSENDPGLISFDPGLHNTAICESGITFSNASEGSLSYRG
jgi:citrate synthase